MGCRPNGPVSQTRDMPFASPLPAVSAPPALAPQPEIDDPGNPVDYTVSHALGSYMVLQRDNYINVWGWSDDIGGILYGEFMGEKRYAVVEEDGSWLIQFSPHPATREEQVMVIYPKNGEKTTFRRILIGDVYLVSGQSNAEVTVHACLKVLPEDYEKQVRHDDPIRLFLQTTDAAIADREKTKTPQQDVVVNSWKWSLPSLGYVHVFSAMGYFFAKELMQYTDVPIGLLQCAAGGAVLREMIPTEMAESFGHVPRPDGQVGLGGFYNVLFAPFTNLHVRGMLFYQGESDGSGDFYKNYDSELAAYVAELRKRFDSDFTFYNVQLSTYGGAPCEGMWPNLPRIREAQWKALYQIPNSYLVTTIDVGWREGEYAFWPDWMHPYHKKPIGERLAHLAAAVEYEARSLEESASPVPSRVIWNKDEVLIAFEYAGEGLRCQVGEELVGFQVFDENDQAESVAAELVDSCTVRVPISNNAKAVGYGMFFLGYAENANLCNAAGYPAPAFRLEREQ